MWLEAKGVMLGAATCEPVEWERPHDGWEPWSFYRWNRRSYAEVMRTSPSDLELVTL
jgi:hypothetical protein